MEELTGFSYVALSGANFFFFLREHYQGQTNNTLKEYRWVRPTSHIIMVNFLTLTVGGTIGIGHLNSSLDSIREMA